MVAATTIESAVLDPLHKSRSSGHRASRGSLPVVRPLPSALADQLPHVLTAARGTQRHSATSSLRALRQSERLTPRPGFHAGLWLDIVLRSSARASCKSGVSSP